MRPEESKFGVQPEGRVNRMALKQREREGKYEEEDMLTYQRQPTFRMCTIQRSGRDQGPDVRRDSSGGQAQLADVQYRRRVL
jgi:hypothetical protein